MIYLLWLVGYLVFGFALIGFIAARDKFDEPLSLGECVIASLTWPLCLLSYMYDKAAEVGDVIPYLRKVFGGPKKN